MNFRRIDRIRRFLAFLLFLFLQNLNYAQVCTGCKTVISSNTSANITIGPSDVVCISPGVTASGNITLNGGTLCNQGTVTNLTLIQGYFNNYGSYSNQSTNLNISGAKNLWIQCYLNSSFDLSNAMNISASTNSDSIMINVYKGAKFSIGKNLSLSQGWLKIRNALDRDHEFLTVQSYLNIGGQLNVSNAALRILNNNYGIFNVNNTVTLDGKYNKKILNYGLFNCNNAFNISGNGQNQYSVLVDNNGTFNITGNLTSSYNNGTVTINNNNYPVKPQPTFVVGKSITITNDNNVFNNYRPLNVALDITMQKGLLLNNSTINARDISISQGVFTNSGSTVASRDLILDNVNAVVNDNAQINIARNFINGGSVYFGKKSVMVTQNYTNQGLGNIYGPTDLNGPAGPDSSNYALIDIIGNSINNGYLRQYIVVYDESFTGTGLRFDSYNNSNRVVSPARVGYPPCFLSVFTVALSSNPRGTICPGSPVVLTARAYNIYSSSPAPVSKYIWLPANVTTVPPINTYNTPVINNITTFSVKVILASGCYISQNITINVSNLTANAGPDKILNTGMTSIGIGLPVGGTGGVPPYTYNWFPSSTLSNPSISNPIATPLSNTTYILSVTDNTGCIAFSKMTVYFATDQYAVLYEKLDGGYHNLVNNKLFFKTIGEYNNSTLIYNIYDKNNQVVASQLITPSLLSTAGVVPGDNRYSMNIGSTSMAAGFYVLEVINEKKEKTYLRFKK